MEMIEVLVRIPKKDFEALQSNYVWWGKHGEYIKNGTILPEDATNGDIIKALFPNGSQVKGASIYVMNDNKSNIFYDFDWWNAPYKAGDTEESDAEFMCRVMSKTMNESTDDRNFIGR